LDDQKSPRDNSWIEKFDEEFLLEFVTKSFLEYPDIKDLTIDEIGNKYLPRRIDGETLYNYWPTYWKDFKKEFRKFICSKDKKYLPLKKKLSSSSKETKVVLISIISAAFSKHLGILAGILVPFCAMCLLLVARIGIEAFCSDDKYNFNKKL